MDEINHQKWKYVAVGLLLVGAMVVVGVCLILLLFGVWKPAAIVWGISAIAMIYLVKESLNWCDAHPQECERIAADHEKLDQKDGRD